MPADPDGTYIVSAVLAVLMLLLAALYAAAESASGCLSPTQLKKDSDAGDKKAIILMKACDPGPGAVSPLQSGLLFCGLFGAAFALSVLQPLFYRAFSAVEGRGLRAVLSCVLAAFLYVLVFAVFGDLLPKKAARHNAESFAYRNAGLIRWLTVSTVPFLSLCLFIVNGILRLFRIDPKTLDNAVTEEEILQMVGEGEEKGVIEENEKDMIQNILDFNDTTAGETMTHRTDIVAVEDTAPISDLVEAAVENGCSRVPVYHEDIDSVVGICYVKDLLPFVGKGVPENVKLIDLMRPAYFIPETKKCSQLFTEMTDRKVQIAIVVDEYGGTAGLVTLEDLVESIVGNIQDEYDNEEEDIHKVSETAFTVDGATSIDELSDLTGVALPEGDYDTIAGLVTEQLGRIPKDGERPQIKVDKLSITVLKVEDQRLSRLLIVKDPEEPIAEPQDDKN